MPARRPAPADGLGLAALAGLYWFGVAILPAGVVTPLAWTTLYVACTAVALLLWWCRLGPSTPAGWLLLALDAAVLAAVFFGVNVGLDALHGPQRARPDVASSLGGLELWFVLCPGGTAIAAAGWVRCLRR